MMKKKILSKKKMYLFFLTSFIIVLASFFIYSLVTGKFTFALFNNDGWDGVTIANSFESGNGTKDNPYVISNAEEFMYFKELIEGDNYYAYQNSYFSLGDDIDLNECLISPIGIIKDGQDRLFEGYFNGNGYTIKNFKIETPTIIDGTSYYGIFTKTINAKVYNLNIDSFSINVKNNEKFVLSTLVGEAVSFISEDDESNSELSYFKNISLTNFYIELPSIKDTINDLGIISNKIDENVSITNFYLNGTYFNDSSYKIYIVNSDDANSASNIVTNLTYSGELVSKNINKHYVMDGKNIYLNDGETSLDFVLSEFNDNNELEYSWIFDDKKLVFRKNVTSINDVVSYSAMTFAFSSRAQSIPLPPVQTGVVGDTVYINDLESDYNYYMGLNYTDYRAEGTLPSTVGAKRNLYNSSNLVKVYMLYDGADLNDSSVVGYVSTTELVSKFVYYKYYVVKNGYIDLELIDNPFANRPIGKYFQGWATDYKGITITHNFDEYLRETRIPVPNGTSEISITFNAVWGEGTTYTYSSNSTAWTTVDDNLDKGAMKELAFSYTYSPAMDTLYLKNSVAKNKTVPSGNWETNGAWIGSSYTCTTTGGCTYYSRNHDTAPVSGKTYYRFTGSSFAVATITSTFARYNNLDVGDNLAGYYKKVTVAYGKSRVGYYSSVGISQTGNCSSTGGCVLYKYMQYYDDNGNVNLHNGERGVYRLVTRDTNVVVLGANISNGPAITPSKPLTITSINNGSMTLRSYALNKNHINATADIRIEYITLNSGVSVTQNSTNFNNTDGYFYGNYNNNKIGRGVVRSGSNYTSYAIFGSDIKDATPSTSVNKFRNIVESGYYNFGAVLNYSTSRSYNYYINSTMVWGSDFDRATNNNNNLELKYSTAATWAGNLYADSSGISTHTIVKSGKIGTSKANISTGLYVGGRYTGSRVGAVEATIEGGWIFSVIGGPSVSSSRANYNDTYINMKGGNVDFIFGGAGETATYGNRIISVTGGTVNYSVFGGSNGSDTTSTTAGKITGSSLIYIGGNAVIGDSALVSSGTTAVFGSEAGSVFGIGDGKGTSYPDIGSMSNSNIIIDGDSLIRKNVYGGGNYGRVGVSGTSSTNINIYGGHIAGSVYGGGNRNGSGTTQVLSTININMSGGIVDQSIYGGSNESGIVYGSTNVNIIKGTINGDVYGGGKGTSTTVSRNVNVNIGRLNASNNDITINNVYGGSAFGKVNNTTTGTTDYKTNVTINSGVIKGSVFGGAKGSDTDTPYVYGDITLNVNGGSITSVYGGFDAKGKPSSNDVVNLNGGVIGSAFGGGRKAGQTTTNINLQGSTITDSLFGGSDQSGTVTNSYVKVTSGIVRNNIFGGGNNVGVTYTDVNFQSAQVKNIYGGSNLNGTSNTGKVIVNSGNISGSVFGGNNSGGYVVKSSVEINNGVISSVYGGGNAAKSGPSNVVINNGIIGDIFGGGNNEGIYASSNASTLNESKAANSTIKINGGSINRVFGGSNNAGNIADAIINVNMSSTTVFTTPENITVNYKIVEKKEMQAIHKNNYPQYQDMKTYAKVLVEIQNNSKIAYSDLKINIDFPTSVILNTASASSTDIKTLEIGTSALISKYNGNNISLDGNSSTSLQFEMFSNAEVADFSFSAGLYSFPSNHIYELFGGNNAGGNVTNSKITANNSSISYVYGGGNNAPVITANVSLNGVTGFNAFGGNNLSETTSSSIITLTNSKLQNVYGGGNSAKNGTSNVTIESGTYSNVFGGGNDATCGNSKVLIKNGVIQNVYGGGNNAGLTTATTGDGSSNVEVTGGKIDNLYGGSNSKGLLKEAKITVNIAKDQISTDTPYSDKLKLDIDYSKNDVDPAILEANRDNENYDDIVSYAKIKVTVTNLFSSPIDEWDLLFNIPESLVYANNSDVTIKEDSTSNNLIRASSISKSGNGSHHTLPVGGSYTFEFEVVSSSSTRNLTVMGEVTNPNDIYIMNDKFNIINLFGGGNKGNKNGHVESTSITIKSGRIVTVYGGGNAATIDSSTVKISDASLSNVYGGGNMAAVNNTTNLNILNSTIYSNAFGGGNEGPVTSSTYIRIKDSSVNGNAFAGGNGSNAVVRRNSTITIDGKTVIGTEKSIAPNSGCVFGSGNAANNGIEADPALNIKAVSGKSTVNLVGGLVYGNVYGGAKMAVVYGEALTYIGTSAVTEKSLTEGNIMVIGSIFGGGESNVSGNSSYDANAISVTSGIEVQINGENYVKNGHDFVINGSIFGSGNASNSSGTSIVYIKSLGTKDKPNQALSIQRTKDLTIDSSFIELSGAKDKTNEALRFQYSFNLIDSLKLVNNSTLLLRHNANVLKSIYSGIYKNGVLEPAVVDINDSAKKVTKNVDNRIYMLTPQVLNVSTRPDANGGYGRITGMTFFGMYTGGSSGYNYGVYDSRYSYGDVGNGDLVIAGGSYIKGLHLEDHDITKDGFYTNYLDEDTYSNITTAYIDPIDIGNNGFQWVIGYPTDTYEVFLTASKFSSLGTYSLGMDGFYKGNTTFTVLGFDSSSMKSGIKIVDYSDVPRVAKTESEANSTFGLAMKAETQEWTGHGVTKYMRNTFQGDNVYRTDVKTGTPSLMFYLYHARNINSDDDLGSCTITMQASIPKNSIENEIRYINIIVYIDASNTEDVEGYDASIAYDKKYELPRFTDVNITNKSQFSAYFSLAEFYDSFDKIYGKNNDYYHVITTDRPLPVNTIITMIDFSANPNRPEYYYLNITEDKYDESVDKLNKKGEVDYRLSDFIKMDSVSSNNTYDDRKANLLYYDEEAKLVDEEFIFIFDFKDTNVTGSYINNYLLFELRGSDDFRRLGVGKNNDIMYYSTYDTSNVALAQNFSNDPRYLYYDIPFSFEYSTAVLYDQTGSGETVVSIIDTNYESSSMGINVSFIDKNGETVSSSLLVGTSLIIGNREYFADGDGVFRIKLTDKVSSVLKDSKIIVNKDLPSGDYTLRYTLFASDDGLHISNTNNSVTTEFDIHVVSSDNYISADCDDKDKIVDGETGLNLNGKNINNYSVKFSSALSNQNFRVYVSKRKIDDADSNEFVNIPFNDLFKNEFNSVGDGGVYIDLLPYRINNFELELNDNLTSGTYRVSFEMYDNNQLIDQDIKYVIIKKKVE